MTARLQRRLIPQLFMDTAVTSDMCMQAFKHDRPTADVSSVAFIHCAHVLESSIVLHATVIPSYNTTVPLAHGKQTPKHWA